MYRLFIVMLLVCILQGCNMSEEKPIERIVLDLDAKEQCSSGAAFDSFDYVKLEMTPESMLTDIGKVLVGKNRIYVLPIRDARVFIYSKTGEYINSLKRGQGPGEVMFVSDMDIVNDELYVLDNYRVVRKYDSDGKYLGNVHSLEDYYCFSMKSIGGEMLFFDPYINKRSDYMLRVMSNNEVAGNYLGKEDNLSKVSFLHYNFCNQGYISWPLSDTIYQYVDKTTILPKYLVSFPDNSFFKLKNDKKYTGDDMCKFNQSKDYYRWLKDVVPYDEGLFLSFNYDKSYYVRYEDGNPTIYGRLLDGFPEIKRSSVGSFDNKLIYVYTAEELLEYKENDDTKKGNEKLVDICRTLSEDDNPVLFFMKL